MEWENVTIQGKTYELVRGFRECSELREAELKVKHHTNLTMFYWEICQAIELFYIKELDTIAAASYEEGVLTLDEVFGKAPLKDVIQALVNGLGDQEKIQVILGFNPKNKSDFEVEAFRDEDSTLFIYGQEFKEIIEHEKLRIPVIART